MAPLAGPQVLAMVLATVRNMAGRNIAKSNAPNAIAAFGVSVPATFGTAQLQAIAEAAEVAGLAAGSLQVLTAPEAVAACYAARHAGDITEARTVAFLNMGHGLTQAAVYRFAPPPTENPGAAVQWEPCGEPVCMDVCGDSLDRAVFDEYQRQIQDKYGITVAPGTKQGFRLMQVCHKARVVLSANKTSTIQLECFGPDQVDILFTVDRAALERLCSPAREALASGLKELLAGAGVAADDLHGLELVGGVTCTPFVQEAAAALVGPDRVRLTMDRASAVAVGAAHAITPGTSARFCPALGPGKPPSVLAEWHAAEVAMAAQDTVLAAIASARNELEAYIFATRDAGETQLPELFDSTGTLPLLAEAEDWLYSDEAAAAEDATVVTDRLTALQKQVRGLNIAWDAGIIAAKAATAEADRVESVRLAAERLAATEQDGGDHDSRRMKKADRMKYVLKNKAEATELFKGGNFALCTQRYIKALAHCGKFVDLSAEDAAEVETLRLALHLNLALVYLKQDAARKALASAEDALRIEGTNAKGLYRRALALEALKDYREALEALRAGAAAAPEDTAIAKALARVQAKMTAETDKEKRMYSKMFT